MNPHKGYKIAILVLSIIVAIQAVLLIRRQPAKPKKKPPAARPAAKGKIAIVIDDWGYNLNNLAIAEQIKYPFTCAVLPNLPYSARASQALRAHGCQIILHLPMEPHEEFRLERDTIMTGMDEQAITGILDKGLASVRQAVGVSNHQGSKAVEDSGTMAVIFKELKKRRLYFLDSFVSPKSVCNDLSKQMGLAFARRDVFLDNRQDYEYIKGQINELRDRAGVYGMAIGIGHDRRLTLQVLKEEMPRLEKEGYRFVFVSDLLRK